MLVQCNKTAKEDTAVLEVLNCLLPCT